jgi:hypothetical protein
MGAEVRFLLPHVPVAIRQHQPALALAHVAEQKESPLYLIGKLLFGPLRRQSCPLKLNFLGIHTLSTLLSPPRRDPHLRCERRHTSPADRPQMKPVANLTPIA